MNTKTIKTSAVALTLSMAFLTGCESTGSLGTASITGLVTYFSAKAFGADTDKAALAAIAVAAATVAIKEYQARKISEAERSRIESEKTSKAVADYNKAGSNGQVLQQNNTQLAVPVGKTTTASGEVATEYAVTDAVTGKVVDDQVVVISDAEAKRAVAEQQKKQSTTSLGKYKVVMLPPTDTAPAE